MKSLLSMIVAAAFAATSYTAVAQTKDVDTKGGGAVTSKDGQVKRKEVKEKPKGGPAPTVNVEKRPKKEKAAPTKVETKGGGEVKTKDAPVNKK